MVVIWDFFPWKCKVAQMQPQILMARRTAFSPLWPHNLPESNPSGPNEPNNLCPYSSVNQGSPGQISSANFLTRFNLLIMSLRVTELPKW